NGSACALVKHKSLDLGVPYTLFLCIAILGQDNVQLVSNKTRRTTRKGKAIVCVKTASTLLTHVNSFLTDKVNNFYELTFASTHLFSYI
ncbi:hypothetical protein, partial [Flavobacterium filum]|uniref:hypothetical protein n=1 Tax=Flavobacterium filum TaxID=370974 RepID=UPI00055379A5